MSSDAEIKSGSVPRPSTSLGSPEHVTGRDAGSGAVVRARRGLLFVVSAPSGTGKTTVVERLVQVVPDLSLSRSYTSRTARPGEADGIDYNFITRARFEAMIAAEAFLEWADVFGNLYGTGADRCGSGIWRPAGTWCS